MDMTVQGMSPAALGESPRNLPSTVRWRQVLDAMDEANSDYFPASDPPE